MKQKFSHLKQLLCEPFLGENDKYYSIYTVFLKNGEYYKGFHTSKKIIDEYIGSSELLKKRIYIDNIEIDRIEISKFANNYEEIAVLEKEHIGEEWRENPLCLNQVPGGLIGGWQLIPKEILDQYRRKSFENFKNNNPEKWIEKSKLGGINGAKSSHAEKTDDGKSLMTSECNKRRSGKIKVRKEWSLINENDKKIFPRIYKRTEDQYEFGSGMCDEELYETILKFDNWYRPDWKTKGKSIHSEETKNQISESCSKSLTGRKFSEEHKKNISISKKQNKKEKNHE